MNGRSTGKTLLHNLIYLVVVAGLTFTALKLYRAPMEQDLAGRATAKLAQAGFTDFSVRAMGRDLVLAGGAISDAVRARAIAVVGDVDGVRVAGFADGRVAGSPVGPVGKPDVETHPEPDTHSSANVDDSDTQVTEHADTSAAVALAVEPVIAAVEPDTTLEPDTTPEPDTTLEPDTTPEPDTTSEPDTTPGPDTTPEPDTTPFAPVMPSGPAIPLLPPTPLNTGQCQRLMAQLLGAQQFQFGSGSAEILDDSESLLEQIAFQLSRCEGMKVRVDGHTDSFGDPKINLKLSKVRARAVSLALALRGVPKALLSYEGYGDARPIASNATRAGRAQNRRIELVIVERASP